MKINYKQKLFLYFFIIFAIFSIGIIVFEQSNEKKHKTETLEEKLDVYADMVDVSLKKHHNQSQILDSLLTLFPQNIRLTLINKQGLVLYDNAIRDLSILENHAHRPEIENALKKGTGTYIRVSSSNDLEYLYYAKRFDDYYIRVALPYNIQVKHFLKTDNIFLYYVIVLFVVMLFLINYVSGRFSTSIKQLRDFTIAAENDETSTLNMHFPEDELGEIGTKITEIYQQLKARKKEISLEREKLLQHVHSSEEGLCFFSANKNVEFYNGLFIQYLNFIIDESNSDPLTVFVDPLFEKVSSFLSEHKTQTNYFDTQINKQGRDFVIRVNIFDDKSFEITINDITKQEKTRLLKQEMTGNIAHELRTPVTSIRGYLETMLEQSLDPEKEHHFLTKAYNQVLVLSELIQDMSLITKIEEVPQSFQLEKIEIKKLLEDIKNDLEIPLQQKRINMGWDVPENVIVNGNRNLLYSVFRNLTDNVIRYAGNDVSIWVSKYNEDRDFYYFSYADTGAGISNEQHLKRLFERFYRINEGRTRDTGGSGLGLSIVKNAIAFHKGTIIAKNKSGGGLEFLFKLPKG